MSESHRPFPFRLDPTTSLAWSGFRRWRAPIWLSLLGVAGIVVTWIPIAVALEARTNLAKTEPRIHLIQDMDNQAKFKPQDQNPLFVDDRAQRPHVPGTVARGELFLDHEYYDGFDEAAGTDGKVSRTFIGGFPQQIQAKLDDPTQAAKLLELGQAKFNITCAMCHGRDAMGNGPIHQRAVEVGAALTGWVQPSNLNDDVRRARTNGHLYNTVNNGIRKMGGYGTQLTPDERWAVVAYVRAVQLANGTPASALPKDKLPFQ